MSSPTCKPLPVSSAKDEPPVEADPGIESVTVECFQIDDRPLCVVRCGRSAFIPLSCFLEWSETTEQALILRLEACGCGMSELPTADSEVRRALQEKPHHSQGFSAPAERLLPIEGAIAYLKVLGKVYEAITLGDRFGDLLPKDSRILPPC